MNYQEELNKKIEETKKKFEKIFSCPVSYHEENKRGRKEGIFTIKIKDPGSEKIGKFFEEGIGVFSPEGRLLNIGKEISAVMDKCGLGECAVSVEKGKKAELIAREINKKNKEGWGGDVANVNSENLEIEEQKNKLIEEGIKDDKNQVDKSEKSLNRHFIDNGGNLTYSVERKDKNSSIRESYIERDKKERELDSDKKTKQEKTDENSPNFNKKENNQKNLSQEINNKNIYYGAGLVSLVLLLVSIAVVRMKKKK